MKTVILFDLDGTLLDSLGDLTDSTNYTLAQYGCPPRTPDEIRSFIGNGAEYLIRMALPGLESDPPVAEALATYKAYYATHARIKTKPYDGVLDMLRALRSAGVKTALVSNKADFAVQALAKDYFEGLFDVALGERADIPRKPAPDMVRHVLHALGETADTAVFIGDSDVDVKTAQNAGTDGIFVTWGFRDAGCLQAAGATNLVSSTDELLDAILA